MTILHRQVNRVTTETYRGRRLVVTLMPGDLIQIRESGRHSKTAFAVPVAWVYLQICKRVADEAVRLKREKRKRVAHA